MRTFRRIALTLAYLAASAPSWAADSAYESRLTPVAYDGAMRANVQGDGHVSASLSGNILTVTGSFTALPSPAVSAKLYGGVGIGVPGDAISDLKFTGQTEGALSATLTLDARQLAALKSGHLYAQINSQKAPDGNLWGWLLPAHAFPGADVPENGQGFLPQLDVPGNWTQK